MRNVDVWLPGKGISNSYGATLVYKIISMIEWIRTRSSSLKQSLATPCKANALHCKVAEPQLFVVSSQPYVVRWCMLCWGVSRVRALRHVECKAKPLSVARVFFSILNVRFEEDPCWIGGVCCAGGGGGCERSQSQTRFLPSWATWCTHCIARALH